MDNLKEIWNNLWNMKTTISELWKYNGVWQWQIRHDRKKISELEDIAIENCQNITQKEKSPSKIMNNH
jgi:hypothetical protein